jgi:hypothetical protein
MLWTFSMPNSFDSLCYSDKCRSERVLLYNYAFYCFHFHQQQCANCYRFSRCVQMHIRFQWLDKQWRVRLRDQQLNDTLFTNWLRLKVKKQQFERRRWLTDESHKLSKFIIIMRVPLFWKFGSLSRSSGWT